MPSVQTPMQKLVRRMTRFFSKLPRADVMEQLSRVFSLLGYRWNHTSANVVSRMVVVFVPVSNGGESHTSANVVSRMVVVFVLVSNGGEIDNDEPSWYGEQRSGLV